MFFYKNKDLNDRRSESKDEFTRNNAIRAWLREPYASRAQASREILSIFRRLAFAGHVQGGIRSRTSN